MGADEARRTELEETVQAGGEKVGRRVENEACLSERKREQEFQRF